MGVFGLTVVVVTTATAIMMIIEVMLSMTVMMCSGCGRDGSIGRVSCGCINCDDGASKGHGSRSSSCFHGDNIRGHSVPMVMVAAVILAVQVIVTDGMVAVMMVMLKA